MKTIVQKILYILAKATIRKYGPLVIGITGSVGKTSTKEAIFAVLKQKYKVRESKKSFNTEIGLPLAIIGGENRGRNIWGWLAEFARAAKNLIFTADYPEILVLEFGVQKPKDMEYLVNLAKPFIGVVTAIGEIPVHVEFFAGPAELIKEKAKLIEALPKEGFAVLNYDDEAVYEMRKKSKAHVLTFGFHEHSEIRIMGYELRTRNDEKLGEIPDGITVKISHGGSVASLRLFDTFGKPQAYAAAAAVAVGLIMNMNLVEIAAALRNYKSPAGRMRLIRGIKNSFILDDTYNAAPEAMHAALDTLRELPARRKIAVLGDMLELGKFTEQAHRAAGLQAAKFCDIIFTVGERAKFIAAEAEGIVQTRSFNNSIDAGNALDPLIREGDLILVKGSQGMRMEKAVEAIMAEPEKVGEFLVRQDQQWKK